MARFVLFRLFQSVGLLFGILVLVFAMVRVTGDPVSLMVAREATNEQREQFRQIYGFDRPLSEQFLDYMGKLLRGDLDRSMSLGTPNAELIAQRLPPTLELALASLGLALAVAVPLGILSGMQPGGVFDFLARALSLMGQSIPSYWMAMVVILIFAVNLRLLPSFGRSGFESLILPTITLALAQIGQLVRLIRGSVIEVRQENYIRTARSKGLSSAAIMRQHILPNVAVPLVSVIGVNFTYLMGGSVYVETVFAWPGLGSLLNNAINGSDFPLVQAITIFIALFVISINFLTDLLYAVVDPRIRYG
jgi:peptide/nickel transport system permease protein